MYGIFTYIYHKNQPNVGKYTIHGLYGNGFAQRFKINPNDEWKDLTDFLDCQDFLGTSGSRCIVLDTVGRNGEGLVVFFLSGGIRGLLTGKINSTRSSPENKGWLEVLLSRILLGKDRFSGFHHVSPVGKEFQN